MAKTSANATVTLTAEYDSKLNNKDSAFMEATPNGKLEMSLYPVSKSDFFTPGKSYYLDIQEVPDEA